MIKTNEWNEYDFKNDGKTRHAYEIVIGNPHEKRSEPKQEDIIINHIEMGPEDANWVENARDTNEVTWNASAYMGNKKRFWRCEMDNYLRRYTRDDGH
jgi:hypothetical protein